MSGDNKGRVKKNPVTFKSTEQITIITDFRKYVYLSVQVYSKNHSK